MKNKYKFSYALYIIAFILFLSSCITQRTIVLEGYKYDKNKDRTEYSVLPYGIAYLPGKWVKTHYNSTSRQQFFKNNDSVKIAIAFIPCDGVEFNKDKSKKGYEFVKSYYEWDSKYFEDKGYERSIIETDKVNNFIIWRLKGENIDAYFLFGENNCNVCNLSVQIAQNWAEDYKIKFLKNIYLNKVE